MCRARNDGNRRCDTRHRVATAHIKLQEAREQISAMQKNGDKIPYHIERKLDNLERRVAAAERVHYQTTHGREELEERLATNRQEYADIENKRTKKARVLRRQILKDEKLQRDSDKYIALQRSPRGDLKERQLLRDESRNRGGVMGPNGHPMTDEVKLAALRSTPQPIELSTWTEEETQPAADWIEEDADTGYIINHRDTKRNHAEQLRERIFRMNMPDGETVETRDRLILRQAKNGKGWVVSRALSVNASFEDASPIDKTTNALGFLSDPQFQAGAKNHREQLGEYTSKKAALKAMTAFSRDMESSPRKAAVIARTALVKRSANSDEKLQSAGWNAWYRYRTGGYKRGAWRTPIKSKTAVYN